MTNDDKLQEKSKDTNKAESNSERDQDAGNMNNGTLGGNFGSSDGDKSTDDDASEKLANESDSSGS